MIIGKAKPAVTVVFAWLPKTTTCGERVWLKWVRRTYRDTVFGSYVYDRIVPVEPPNRTYQYEDCDFLGLQPPRRDKYMPGDIVTGYGIAPHDRGV